MNEGARHTIGPRKCPTGFAAGIFQESPLAGRVQEVDQALSTLDVEPLGRT